MRLAGYIFTALHSSYAFIAIAALQKEAYVEVSRRGTPPILPRWLFPSGGFLTFTIQAGLFSPALFLPVIQNCAHQSVQ
ncbi:hypothetical protein [Phyllobacterium sp. SB3]|uniref:hypothetical protein n=1 Tax=Phyllobacterium sp. SB3 TaxID=3156073 RepID=UPI0032AE9444